jgi:hypothetical protein
MNVSFSQNRAFHPEGDSWNYSQIRQIRRFEGVRFLPNSPTLGPMHASHVTNPREANLDESEGDTWTSHGLKGPRVGKLPQNQVDTGNWRKSPHDSHHEEAHLEWGPQGVGRPHRSAKPTLRPPLRGFHVVIPGWSWCPFHKEAHFLPNSLSNSSFTFGLQG